MKDQQFKSVRTDLKNYKPINDRVRQRAIHAKAYEQGHQRMLLSFGVITRLDYCNSVLAGLSACTLAPLQRVQNVAALTCD